MDYLTAMLIFYAMFCLLLLCVCEMLVDMCKDKE